MFTYIKNASKKVAVRMLIFIVLAAILLPAITFVGETAVGPNWTYNHCPATAWEAARTLGLQSNAWREISAGVWQVNAPYFVWNGNDIHVPDKDKGMADIAIMTPHDGVVHAYVINNARILTEYTLGFNVIQITWTCKKQ